MAILIFERENPADLDIYASGLAAALPGIEVEVAATEAEAIAKAASCTALAAKAPYVPQALIDAMPIHVWTASADGSDVFFNSRRLEYTGPGVDWYSIVHPDERIEHDATWHAAVRRGQPFEFVQRLVAHDGSSRWFLGRAAPLRDQALLWKGAEPYPDGWRAAVRRPTTLPHYPVISHRGGFPDGS